MEKKVTDLRREVKERLTKKGIVDFSEFKLKPIQVVGEKDDKKIRNSLERNLTKIGNSLINEIVYSDISEDDKVAEINKLLVGDVKVNISTTSDSNVSRLKKSFKKGTIEADTYLNITVEEGDTLQHTFSTMYFEPTKKQEGIFSFRFDKSGYIPFANLKKLVGTIYYLQKLREYIKTNKEMSNLVYVKYIQTQGIYKDEDHKLKIDKLAKEYDLPPSKYVNYYISGLRENSQNWYKKQKMFDYLDWFEDNKFFNLDSIFEVSAIEDRYNLYKVKNVSLLSYFFNHIYELNAEEEYDVKEELSICSDYARSYETKKNIPLKVLNKMETTRFKTHFGYVEFDELVDLDKIGIVEKEWEEINKQVLFPIAKDHSLRFRRLGKHKAAGLYFSGMRAVCVDLEGPSSMVHEVMHMIDYTTLPNATLSSLFNFRGIIERYREIANNKVASMEKDNGFRKTWEGNTKYNKAYYLSSKEIFARCGEMYIEKVLGIESSLVKANNPTLYPANDEFLMELIAKYYSSIIQTAPDEKEEFKAASAKTSIMTKEEVVKVLSKYQLSIFDMVGENI